MALAPQPMDWVASSNLVRSVETADIIFAAQGSATRDTVPKRKQMDLLGEMFYGSLEGVPIAESRSAIDALDQAWKGGDTSVRVGGDGESPDELLIRARAALWGDEEGIMRSVGVGEHVAVVAHSTFNKCAIADCSGAALGGFMAVPQDNACVNIFDCLHDGSELKVTVVALNLKAA